MASASTANEPPAKRQKVAQPKRLWTDFTSNEFLKYSALYRGPMVTIQVNDTKFEVAEDLLYYYSPYFEAAFKGGFKEGDEKKMDFKDCSADTFALAVQWMHNSTINVLGDTAPEASPIPNTDASSHNGKQDGIQRIGCAAGDAKTATPAQSRQNSATPSEAETKLKAWVEDEGLHIEFYPGFAHNGKAQTVSRLLAFLKLADKINLLGPFHSVMTAIKEAIVPLNRRGLLPGHIRLAAEFPLTHPVRKLFADACYREFVQDLIPGSGNSKPFRFNKEIDELHSFSSDLLRSYRESGKSRGQNKKGAIEYIFIDPFTDGKFTIVA